MQSHMPNFMIWYIQYNNLLNGAFLMESLIYIEEKQIN